MSASARGMRLGRLAGSALGTLAAGGAAWAQALGEVNVKGAPAKVETGAMISFWLLAILVVGGALVTVTRRNAVSAVMALVATFFGLAAMYAMLSAHFLAAVQILVYAGAIMTLFVFVVMVLNREESEPWAMHGAITKGVGVAALAYLIVKLTTYLFRETASRPEAPDVLFGSVADIGGKLFTTYLFAFEAVSLPLLVAVIGAVVVARTPRVVKHEHAGGLAPDVPDVVQLPAGSGDAHAAAPTGDAHGHSGGH